MITNRHHIVIFKIPEQKLLQCYNTWNEEYQLILDRLYLADGLTQTVLKFVTFCRHYIYKTCTILTLNSINPAN